MTAITVSVNIGTYQIEAKPNSQLESSTDHSVAILAQVFWFKFTQRCSRMAPPVCRACGATACTELANEKLRRTWKREPGLKWDWHTDHQAYWLVCLPCHLAAWAVDRRTNNRWSMPGWQYDGATTRRARGGRVRLVSGGDFYLTEPVPEYLRPRAQASAPLAATAAPPDLRRRPAASLPLEGAFAPAPSAPTSGQALAAAAGAAPFPAAPTAPAGLAPSASSTTPAPQPPLRSCLKGTRGLLLETGPSIGRRAPEGFWRLGGGLMRPMRRRELARKEETKEVRPTN